MDVEKVNIRLSWASRLECFTSVGRKCSLLFSFASLHPESVGNTTRFVALLLWFSELERFLFGFSMNSVLLPVELYPEFGSASDTLSDLTDDLVLFIRGCKLSVKSPL